jgi:ATP-dependent RNA helicase DOB1
VKTYYESQNSIIALKDKLQKIICVPEIILPFLSIGRLVFIKKGEVDWGWGVSLNFNKKKMAIKHKKKNTDQTDQYIIDVMTHIKPRGKNEDPVPVSMD